LIHAFTIKCAVYGSLAAKLAGVPARVNAVAGMGYVFTSSDVRARALRPIVRTLMHIAFGGGQSRLILQNPDDLAMFTGNSLVDSATVRLIPGSGVDCNRFRAEPAVVAPRTGSRLRVLLPARLLWDKGIAEYVDAARLLLSQRRNLECLLAGQPDEGNPAAVPENTLLAWQAEGIVQWLGHVEDMPALLQSVDVVVLPSYREGLPKVLIEAAACGLPLVTTDVPGCRHVVENGVDGLLVPPKNPAALAQAIGMLDDHPELRARLGGAARRKALALFDERTIVARTLDVYRELIPGF
jgi:glycosyltransferase involved in cell wall biosynthesis